VRILLATTDSAHASLLRSALVRFRYDWTEVDDGVEAFQTAFGRPYDLLVLDFDLPRMTAPEVLRRLHSIAGGEVPPAIVITQTEGERERLEAEGMNGTAILARPLSARRFVERVVRILDHRTTVSCIGGGTGLFTLLSGLKTIPGIRLTSIVSMSDDGGSTGRLRDRFGVLPPGDVRRSLVALSNAPDLLNRLMQYRFERGEELDGHNLGNLVLTALSEMRGSMSAAVRSLGEILDIRGEVVPVTETSNTLKAELVSGEVLTGEHRIDMFPGGGNGTRIARLWCDPPAAANPEALKALRRSDFVVLGPGDLFTSIVSNLVVDGIPEAVVASPATKIYVVNVMTKPGETRGFTAADHVRQVVRYLGEDCLDHVVCSTTGFDAPALEHYAARDQAPVLADAETLSAVTRANVVRADVASSSELVRHDSLKLAGELRKLLDHSGCE
jgi:uncharacterized cofD-like protein